MKKLSEFIVGILLDVLSSFALLAAILGIAYAVMSIIHKGFAGVLVGVVVALCAALIGSGLAHLSVKGDKKRTKQKIIDNFWINLLPPW
jgi:uncharacterized membrane protein AbrB (regulator of aidB expression)